MRYDQVDVALSFLSEPGSSIILQTRFHKDLNGIQRYVLGKLGEPQWLTPARWHYDGDREVWFEAVDIWCEGGHAFPAFLIERAEGKMPEGIMGYEV